MKIEISPSIHDSAYTPEKAGECNDWMLESTVSMTFNPDENPFKVLKDLLLAKSPHFRNHIDGWVEELSMDGSVEESD